MTVDQQVANLVTSVDNLTDKVSVKMSTITTSVIDAQSARDQTQAFRDTADLHKLAAQAAAASATNTASALAGFDLDAIAAVKAGTAVDVFIYDTSLDSDGGAWRHRCTGISWFNEPLNTTTRGARREFPAVAVIVLENGKVTIYDGDDPTLPMWMVFLGGYSGSTYRMLSSNSGQTSIAMLNGKVCVGDNPDAVYVWDFLTETAIQHFSSGRFIFSRLFSERNDLLPRVQVTGKNIASSIVNDVAMTVLSDAPIDYATGLPVPTIAVATGGGVSMIRHDGTVVNGVSDTNSDFVAFSDYGLWWDQYSSTRLYFATFSSIAAGSGFGLWVGSNSPNSGRSINILARSDGDFISARNTFWSGCRVANNAAVAGLMARAIDHADQSKGMSALLTSTYNTGWMNGDIKGAFLSDTDDTDLVFGGIDDDFSSYATQAEAEAAGYEFVNGALFNAALASLEISAGTSVNFSSIYSGQVGEILKVKFSIANRTTGILVLQENFIGKITGNGNGTFSGEFVRGSGALRFVAASGFDGAVTSLKVEKIDTDRSANSKGLIINGTITREPVAPGADLVAYSGFSSGSYLEQPYNQDLDFGTGDFCVMGWAKTDNPSLCWILDTVDADNTEGFALYKNTDGTVVLRTRNSNNSSVVSAGSIETNTWRFIVATVMNDGSKLSIYFDGALNSQSNGVAPRSIGGTDAPLILGGRNFSPNAPFPGSLALWRISATAPTSDQIRKIYEDERKLFQHGAQCTLYGTSDAVTALAHDPKTNLLHVGTNQGRSVFDGLLRVANTEIPVTTAISAVGGMIAEQ
jgi:hypothetical protein